MDAIFVTGGTAEEIAALVVALQGRRDAVIPSDEERRRQECLNLAKVSGVSLSGAQELHDMLLKPDRQSGDCKQ